MANNADGARGGGGGRVRHRLHYVGRGHSQVVSDYEMRATRQQQETEVLPDADSWRKTGTVAPEEVQRVLQEPANQVRLFFCADLLARGAPLIFRD
jgi:hypothetical protein